MHSLGLLGRHDELQGPEQQRDVACWPQMHDSWSQTEPEIVPLPFVLQGRSSSSPFLAEEVMLVKMRGKVELWKQKRKNIAGSLKNAPNRCKTPSAQNPLAQCSEFWVARLPPFCFFRALHLPPA